MKLFLLWKTMVDGKNYGTYTMKITMVLYLELSNFDLGWVSNLSFHPPPPRPYQTNPQKYNPTNLKIEKPCKLDPTNLYDSTAFAYTLYIFNFL